MKINAKDLLRSHLKQKKSIGAFNVSSIEAIRAVFEVAHSLQLPALIETSEGEARYLTPELICELCEYYSKKHSVDYALHLDHGKDLDFIKECLKCGYNSIHILYAEAPYSKNIKMTKQARNITNQYNAQLEGEVGVITLKYYKDKFEGEIEMTDPDEAIEYVNDTHVDSLAISIGTESGRYKDAKHIDIERLQKVHSLLRDIPLVLHGGSYLPKKVYREVMKHGITKINVNAELRVAYTDTLVENQKTNSDEYAPYRLLAGTCDAMKVVLKEKMSIFNS